MPIFENSFGFLMDLNLETITVLCRLLDLPFPTGKTTRYQTKPENIQDGRSLICAKEKNPMPTPEYPQVFQERHGFLQNLSTLDLLFNEGPAAKAYLKGIEFPWNA